MAFAFLFPGQGSQSLKMMNGFGDLPVVQHTFQEASDALGVDLWGMLQAETPEAINATVNTQPIMLTAAIVNRRPEAEFNFIAPTIQIANIAFDQAMGTVRIDPELDKLFQCIPHKRTIQHRLTGTNLQIKAADTDVVTGGKPVGTMIDETHVFASKSRADAIFVELRGALAARPDGFFFQTTTQSKEPPAGVFKEELTNARKVRDGELDLPLLPILYEYPEDMVEAEAWRDPSTWDMVNPNLGRSVDEGFLERELRKAQAEGRHKVALVVSQHFNIEIGMRLHGDRWGGADFWEAAARPGLKLEAILARSDVVTIGIDGGGLDDLLGAAVLGRDKETGQLMLWTHAWCDPIVLERRAQIAPKLLDLEKAGDLTICRESDTQDLDELIALIASIATQAACVLLVFRLMFRTASKPCLLQADQARGVIRDTLRECWRDAKREEMDR